MTQAILFNTIIFNLGVDQAKELSLDQEIKNAEHQKRLLHMEAEHQERLKALKQVSYPNLLKLFTAWYIGLFVSVKWN